MEGMESAPVDNGTSMGLPEGMEAHEGGESLEFFTGQKRHPSNVRKSDGTKPQAKHSYEPTPKAAMKDAHAPGADEEVEDPDATEDEPETEETAKRHKVVINGKEQRVSLKELKSDYQLKQASYARMQEAASKIKEAESYFAERAQEFETNEHALKTYNQLFENLKESPSSAFDIMAKLGHDPRKLAEEYLYGIWQDANMPEEQRQLREERAEKARLQAQLAKFQEQETARQKQERISAYQEDLDSQFKSLFEKIGGRPHPEVLENILSSVARSLKAGQPITVEQAYAQMQALVPKKRAQWLQGISDEELDSMPELIERVQQRALQKIRSEAVPGRKASAPSQAMRSEREDKEFTVDDFFAQRERAAQRKARTSY